MMYFVRLKNGRTLWVDADRARDLQQGNKLLYVIAENPRHSTGNEQQSGTEK